MSWALTLKITLMQSKQVIVGPSADFILKYVFLKMNWMSVRKRQEVHDKVLGDIERVQRREGRLPRHVHWCQHDCCVWDAGCH